MVKLSVFLLATALTPLLLVAAVEEPSESADDQKTEIRRLVDDTRQLSAQAKDGIVLEELYKDVLDLSKRAADLINDLPKQASQCETDLEIKMAASGVGSHEVLTLLLADDQLKVMNGRLSLSLAFMEHLAQQLLDESTMKDSDVGPHLAALVFGAKSTAAIVKQADKAAKQAAVSIQKVEEAAPAQASEDTTEDTSEDATGDATEDANTPATRSIRVYELPQGFRFTPFHSPSVVAARKRTWTGNLGGNYDHRTGTWGVGGQASWTNKRGNAKFSVNGGYSNSGGWNGGVSFGLKF